MVLFKSQNLSQASKVHFIEKTDLSVEWVPDEGRVLDFSNPFITYIYLLFYSMALVAFLFFLSTFFNNREYCFDHY